MVRDGVLRRTLRGAAAGAAGTTALNAVTYLDMLIRARPASSTPQETVERVAARTPLDVPGDGETRANRVSALGSMLGLATGVAIGGGYGALRPARARRSVLAGAVLAAAAAMVGANAPMTLLGVTDPRAWKSKDWLADALPHLAYGLVTATVYAGSADGGRRR